MSIKPGKYRIHTFSDYNKVISVEPTGNYQKPVVVASPAFSPKASIWNVVQGPEPDLYVLSVGGDTAYDAGDEVFAQYMRPVFWRIVQHGHPWGFKILRPDANEGWFLENTNPLTQVQMGEAPSGAGVGAFLFEFEWIGN